MCELLIVVDWLSCLRFKPTAITKDEADDGKHNHKDEGKDSCWVRRRPRHHNRIVIVILLWSKPLILLNELLVVVVPRFLVLPFYPGVYLGKFGFGEIRVRRQVKIIPRWDQSDITIPLDWGIRSILLKLGIAHLAFLVLLVLLINFLLLRCIWCVNDRFLVLNRYKRLFFIDFTDFLDISLFLLGWFKNLNIKLDKSRFLLLMLYLRVVVLTVLATTSRAITNGKQLYLYFPMISFI